MKKKVLIIVFLLLLPLAFANDSCISTKDCLSGFTCVQKECVDVNEVNDILGSSTTAVEAAPEEIDTTESDDKSLARVVSGADVEVQDEGNSIAVSCASTDALQYDEDLQRYTLLLEKNKMLQMVVQDQTDLLFSTSGEVIAYSGDGEAYPTSQVLLQYSTGALYDMFYLKDNGKYAPIDRKNLEIYGVPYLSAGDDAVLYSYASDPHSFLIEGFYLSLVEGEVRACAFEDVLPECSDGIDNDGDGFIDYSGGYVRDEQLVSFCYCDFDGNGLALIDEFVGPELCEGYEYYCESFSHDGREGKTTGAEYVYYDESCVDGETVSEGTGHCVDTYYVGMSDVCLDLYPEFSSADECLAAHASEMHAVCEDSYHGGADSCVYHEDCGEGFYCDPEIFSCVPADIQAEDKELKTCQVQSDCSKGTVCREHHCVKDLQSVGVITPNNPFLSFPKQIVEGTVSVVNRNPEYQMSLAHKRQVELRVLENSREQGSISTEDFNKHRDNTLERSSEILEKASDRTLRQLERNPESPESKRVAVQLGNVAGLVHKGVDNYKAESSIAAQASDRVDRVSQEVIESDASPSTLKLRLQEQTNVLRDDENLAMERMEANALRSYPSGLRADVSTVEDSDGEVMITRRTDSTLTDRTALSSARAQALAEQDESGSSQQATFTRRTQDSGSSNALTDGTGSGDEERTSRNTLRRRSATSGSSSNTIPRRRSQITGNAIYAPEDESVTSIWEFLFFIRD